MHACVRRHACIRMCMSRYAHVCARERACPNVSIFIYSLLKHSLSQVLFRSDHASVVGVYSLPSPLPPCSAVLYSPFSLGDIVILGFLSAVSLFAMIVYARYSLIMAGCIADSISMIPRTVIVSFAVEFPSHTVLSNMLDSYRCRPPRKVLRRYTLKGPVPSTAA